MMPETSSFFCLGFGIRVLPFGLDTITGLHQKKPNINMWYDARVSALSFVGRFLWEVLIDTEHDWFRESRILGERVDSYGRGP